MSDSENTKVGRDRPGRRFPRVPSSRTVLVRSLDSEGHEELAKTKELALGGCSFLSAEPPEDDDILQVRISLNQDVASALARVVYLRPVEPAGFEVGLEFLQIEPSDRGIIENLIREGG